MYSFYGGKQGRTYNLVERYDQIYIDQTDIKTQDNPNGKLISFISGQQYNFGDYLFYQGNVYLVLYQTEAEENKININTSKIQLVTTDLNNSNYVARIKGMVNEFQKGGAYTDANYGQYVIIDTILNQNHKNDDINGIIYRRGFDYTEPVAAYRRPTKIDRGTRTLPNPNGGQGIEFQNLYLYHDYEAIQNGNQWNAIDKGFNTNRWVAAWRKYILKPGGGAIYVGQVVGPQGDSPEIIGLSWSDFLKKQNEVGIEQHYNNIQMEHIPGWSSQGGYNDYIRTGFCNIKDADGNITGAYLSFNIPQIVFNVSAQSIDPYGINTRNHYDEASYKTDRDIDILTVHDLNSPVWKYYNLIHQHSKSGIENGHPFYYNFDIAVPNGIHGQDINSIKLQQGQNIHYIPTKDTQIIEEKVYYIYQEDEEDGRSGYVEVESPNIEDIGSYYEQLTDIRGDFVVDADEYITYYTKHYNNKAEGDISQPLGIWPYRIIDNITPILKDRIYFNNWTFTSYSEQDNQQITYTGFANIGDLYMLYIADEEPETQEEGQELPVKNFMVICKKEGITGTEQDFIANFQAIYTELQNQYQQQDDILKELLKIQITSGQSTWNFIKINSDTPVSSLQINYKAGNPDFTSLRAVDYFTVDDNGNFYVSYSDSPQLFYLSNIGRIKDIIFENSQLVFDFGEHRESFTVKQINNIEIENQDNITGRQRWKINYKGLDSEYASEPINSILAIDKMGDNIIVLYSDPVFRESFKTGKEENIDYYIKDWTDPVTGVFYEDLLWVNLHNTDGTYHILGTTTYDKLAINSTDTTYKNGLTGSHAGWVVTVFDDNENKYKFFAYDYINKTTTGTYTIGNNIRSNWYQVSSLTDEAINPEKTILLSKEGENGKPLESDTILKNNGFWFVVSGGHDSNYGENL